MSEVVRLAIQKSGRLSEDSVELIRECGIDFENGRGTSKLRAVAYNFPIEILYLRDDDIPGYVADGVVDLGIVGENVVAETNAEVRTLERLGFSKCRLSLAVPKGQDYSSIKDLQGKNIATSYPRILSEFLKARDVRCTIHEISGSVEVAPSLGLSQAICDIVGSGSTLVSNGLKEVEVVFESQAVLVANTALAEEKKAAVEQLLFRLRSVLKAKNTKYILLNAPNEALEKIVSILPGMKSPTVLPLAASGWSSVHSVVQEDEFWEIIGNLRAAGAQGILVLPIEKMIL